MKVIIETDESFQDFPPGEIYFRFSITKSGRLSLLGRAKGVFDNDETSPEDWTFINSGKYIFPYVIDLLRDYASENEE